VPGYEAVGTIVDAGANQQDRIGQTVFVPGSSKFEGARGLFGGAARRLVVPAGRAVRISDGLSEKGVLFALAATAHHVISPAGAQLPDLIIGHGVLGRMLARIVVARGGCPTVWETNPDRRAGAHSYAVIDAAADERRNYKTICDVSGAGEMLDGLISRLAPGGEIVLAGFYDEPLAFAFPPAFMREARIRVAAQWAEGDLAAVKQMVEDGSLSLDDLITHCQAATEADSAYRTAFSDPTCLKMILDWRQAS
jgi:3-hydroxyethyl bacteriochlorophyllide a dehydrogenase